MMIYDCEIDYLEGNGNSYFIKEVGEALLHDKIAFEVGFWITNKVNQMRIVGNSNLYINGGGLLAHYTPSWTSTNIVPRGPYNTVKIDNVSKTREINEVRSTFTTSFTDESTSYISIFTQIGNTSRTAQGRVYYFKFWYDGELIYDCIPVRKGSVGYLYDKVHDDIWENAGTEPWVLGKDIIPFNQFTRLDYIENTNDLEYDYIDLQYFPNTNTDIVCNYLMYDNYDDTNGNFIGLYGTRGTSYNSNALAWTPFCGNNTYTDRTVRGNRSNTFTDNYKYVKSLHYRKNRYFFLYKNVTDADYYRTQAITQSTATYSAIRSLFVFAENGNDTAAKAFNRTFLGRIYDFKVYENNELVKDLVPVRHKDGTYGFYDLITNKFHYGNNPSTFTGGNEFVRDTYDAEIDYLETDGLAYIDTNVALGNDLNFEADIYLTDYTKYSNNSIILGGQNSGSAERQILFYSQDRDNFSWAYSNALTDFSIGSNQRHFIKSVGNSVGLYPSLNIDDEITVTGTSTTTFNNTCTFFIFNGNHAGNPLSPYDDNNQLKLAGTKIYSLKLYKHNILVRDFIPVRKNGIGYLYDKVSGKLFGNANTEGNFILGNDINTPLNIIGKPKVSSIRRLMILLMPKKVN